MAGAAVKRTYYSDSLDDFVAKEAGGIRNQLAGESAGAGFPPLQSQLAAWDEEIRLLQKVLRTRSGVVYFEFSIPRMGRRADVVLLIEGVIFVLEFKVGERHFSRSAQDQVWDYALDLKNFHETSHSAHVVPVLIATAASGLRGLPLTFDPDRTCPPVLTGPDGLAAALDAMLGLAGAGGIDRLWWESGGYRPTPTIVEAATALYNGHSVEEISRRDADAVNLGRTSGILAEIIQTARARRRKSICFVTGVPGAGKTLVGLNTATRFLEPKDELHSVFLSGNGPLVKVLCEALARDQVRQGRERGQPVPLSGARSRVKAFIQNVHHFRDECLVDDRPPAEHVALFDEAQRAWDLAQTSRFMAQKKNRPGFRQSEPEFLVSCLDRHRDWAVIVCLVGGGQEINTGEAGIGEWIEALNRSFPDWGVHVSPRLEEAEFGSGDLRRLLADRRGVEFHEDLHLSTSMRSFRAENVSRFVKQVLDFDRAGARASLDRCRPAYPLFLTRRMETARRWLRSRARGSERYGIVVSSKAERLRPHAISVRSPVSPVDWFLAGKEDVRSSYYLEDVATEFHVQGLELDWACVTWDADLRYSPDGWDHWSFHGDAWKRICKDARRRYHINAYRVLMTRARQGMILVVPEGDREDPTRAPDYYDSTYS